MPNLSDLGNYAQIASLPLTVLVWLVTAERFGKFWKRWGKLMLLVLAGVAFFAAWRLGFIQAAWAFATVAVSTPRWFFWLLVMFATAVAIVAALATWRKVTAPSFLDYKEDTVAGVIWRWSYRNNQIADPWCYCPSCDMTLTYTERVDDSEYGFGRTYTVLHCERCNRDMPAIQGDHDHLINRVKRHIDHAIRTGRTKNTNLPY